MTGNNVRAGAARWTAEDIAHLKRIAAERFSADAIAMILGRTPSAVKARAAKELIAIKGQRLTWDEP